MIKLNNYVKMYNFFRFNKFRFCEAWQRVIIPLDKLKFAYSRSSGAGGQNVNKLNTKVEIRFNVEEADWISDVCKLQLKEQHLNKITKDGYFVICCQEHRTQEQNKKEIVKKLQFILDSCSILKEARSNEPVEETEEMEEKRIKTKKIRSDVKKARKGLDF